MSQLEDITTAGFCVGQPQREEHQLLTHQFCFPVGYIYTATADEPPGLGSPTRASGAPASALQVAVWMSWLRLATRPPSGSTQRFSVGSHEPHHRTSLPPIPARPEQAHARLAGVSSPPKEAWAQARKGWEEICHLRWICPTGDIDIDMSKRVPGLRAGSSV